MSNWRDVIGFDGLYQVSRFGVVRSIDRVVMVARNGSTYQKRLKGAILPTHTDSYGYSVCMLCSKRMRVHRIVAEAWLATPKPTQIVCHGPNGKADNSVNNLSWGSHSSNGFDRRRDGLTRRIRRSDGKEYVNSVEASEIDGHCARSVRRVCSGKGQTHHGYGWSYIKG